jgi:MFS family permease
VNRFGALVERNFRLFFSATTISAIGDGVASIALVFAVLHISNNSATAVGVVLACRQAAAAIVALAAGVIADRLPRHVVLVVVAGVQTVVQATAGMLIVTGRAEIWELAALAIVYGLADGFVIPATQGLIPAVVSAARLQQANALIGLSRSILGFAAPAIGGILVAAGSPGAAILIDAASFGVAAILIWRLHVPQRDDVVEPEPFLRELREGWGEFTRQRWLFTTIVFFGIANFAGSGFGVLAPLVAKEHYHGATGYWIILATFGLGTVIGGLIALRWKPERALLASCAASLPLCLGLISIGLLLPYPVVLAGQLVAGTGLAIHLALWFTVFQQQVPEHARSRVSSYDALGSFILVPLGTALAGPLAAWVGVREAMVLTGCIELLMCGIVVASPSVRAVRRLPVESVPQAA